MINFKAFASVCVLTSLLSVSSVLAMNGGGEFSDELVFGKPVARHTPAALKEAGERYTAFMTKAGQSNTPITQEDIDKVFAHKCTKTVNFKDILTESSMLIEQLAAARKKVGKWTMNDITINPNPYCGYCAIQFTWVGENAPKNFVKADLHANESGMFFWINEAYNECDVTLGTKPVDAKEGVAEVSQ